MEGLEQIFDPTNFYEVLGKQQRKLDFVTSLRSSDPLGVADSDLLSFPICTVNPLIHTLFLSGQ